MSLALRNSAPLLRAYCASFGPFRALRRLPPSTALQYSKLLLLKWCPRYVRELRHIQIAPKSEGPQLGDVSRILEIRGH